MTSSRLDPSVTNSLPDLTPSEWGKVGGGIALVLAGSGLVSIGTLIRLGLIASGGVLAYQTLAAKTAQRHTTDDGTKATTPVRSPGTPAAAGSSFDRLPSLRETLVPSGEKADGSLAGAKDVPAVDLRGA